MKRKLLLMTLAVWHIGLAFAQDKKVKVTGDVTDYETTEAVIAATVQLLILPDSSFQSGATTDMKGRFELEGRLPLGNYAVKVSFVGYGDAYRNFSVTESTHRVQLDSIRLKTDALLLKEAIVEAQMAQVQISEDTVIFNAETFRVPEGSMLEELIRKLPGYEVGDDGTVTYNGKTVSKILVDGKEFFSEDKSIAMKNLPASMVKKVKSYEKKSDLAEMTGIDDGEEELVLDLTVKEDAKKGWFSNIDMGYGRPMQSNEYNINNLYTVKGMVNRFKDNEHYSVILSTNNINDRGFPGGGGGRGGRGGGNGMNQSSMGGFSLAKNLGEEVEKNKYQFQIGGGLRFFHNDSDVQSMTASETFLEEGSDNSFSNSASRSNNESLRVNADLRLQWRPDTMTNIIFRPSVGYSKSNNASENLSATFNKDPYEVLDEKYADEGYDPLDSAWIDDSRINYNSRQSGGGSENTSVNGRLEINRKFNSEGRNLTLSLNGGYSVSKSFSNSTSFTRFYQRNDSISTINRYNTTPSKNYNYSTRAMWSEPLWKATFLQLSYQFSYRYNDSQRSTYELPDKLDNWQLPDWILPDDYERYRSEALSQFATYENFDHDITAQLRFIREKYNMNVGFTLLPQRSKMSYQYMGVDIDTVRTVFNFTPTMNFRYRWTKQRSLRINYRGRSSQPSMTDLLDITDDSDPLNITKGNPGLKPTFTNSLNLQFQDFNVDRLQNISANLRFNSTLNSIVNKITYNEETGGRESQPTNLDGWWSNWSAAAGIAYNTALPNQRYKVSSSTNANYNYQEGYVRTKSDDNSFPLAATRSVTLSEHLSGTYQNDWLEITLQGSLNYNRARNNLQPTANRDTYIFSYGPSTNIQLPWWNIKISSDIGMNSRRGFSDPEFNTNELIWNAQLSKSFLAQKAATVSVQFYDILGQQSNVSRIVNATMRSDTWYNTVNSYFMVHFIYKLNLFGDKQSRKEARTNKTERAMPPMPNGERPPMFPTRGGGMPMGGPGMGFGGGFSGGFGPM
ncbi:MAG: outer membrane beta-barrel protein [Bacteroidaceae bacterium]|nr:outer membrane beta-barrel protein [Bacteroidaceae bacterium]